jgi:N-acetylmuramoyl-L-alanine amidase
MVKQTNGHRSIPKYFTILIALLLSVSAASNTAAAQTEANDEIPLPRAEVLIDAGHGGVDGGAHYEDTLEKDINLAVAQKLYLLLRSQGVAAVLNRSGDYALSDENRWHAGSSRHRKDLSHRSQLPSEIPTTLMISLHVNWGIRSAHGPLVLHQKDGRSALLAAFIQEALNRQQHIVRLPKTGKPYYLLRTVKSPAVIVEMGFLSNAADRHMLTNPRDQQRIASAIANGVRHYLIMVGT